MLEQAPATGSMNAQATIHLNVVLSQGQSRNPEKRALEEAIVAYFQQQPGVRTIVIPHLYDLSLDGESYQTLRQLSEPLVLLSWIYGRAAHWVLDRHGVRGCEGELLLKPTDEDEDEDESDEEEDDAEDSEADPRMIDIHPRPDRLIYCLDLRLSNEPTAFIEEVERISQLHATTETAGKESPAAEPGKVSQASMARFQFPTNSTALTIDGSGKLAIGELAEAGMEAQAYTPPAHSLQVNETPGRRWYPVIDFSRCTNCMECIDFCLFGVYGVDKAETILVEQPDNCRKGCPACSRVCPANAIIFPQHKTPAIAGANVDVGSMKIDLSKLFGAPERDEDPVAAAARERDEQLILAGRQAVGTAEAPRTPPAATPKRTTNDAFDQLLDQLDASDI